jgi:hypothetical protein
MDPDSTLADLEKRRADRKAAAKAAHDAQYLTDLGALDKLEQEHGDGRVSALKLPAYSPGLPVMVVVATPSEPAFRRFRDQVRKAKGAGDKSGDAMDMLARSCVAYPEMAIYSQMCAVCPGLHDSVGARAVKLAEAQADDEGKE